MTRTADDVLKTIDAVLLDVERSDVPLTPESAANLRRLVDEGLTDLDERPQPAELGAATEAFGAVLDVANRLSPANRLTLEALSSAHDRLVELVRIGLADLSTRPQGEIELTAPAELGPYEQEHAVDLALRWTEIEPTGPPLLVRVGIVRSILRGEPIEIVPKAAVARLRGLVEEWREAAATATNTPAGNARRAAFEAASIQTLRVLDGG